MVRRNGKLVILPEDLRDFPRPPRFIHHDELTKRGTAQRLFKKASDPPSEGRLPHASELILFKRLQYCAYRMNKMWDHLPRLNQDGRQRYIGWHRKRIAVRERIIGANYGLVFNLLSKNRFTNVEFDELRSEGLMALVRAVGTYNPWSGFRFSTYACNCIVRAFSRMALMAGKRSHLWSSSFDPQLEPSEWTVDRRTDHVGLVAERLNTILDQKSTWLSASEKFVLQQRFPLQPNRQKATLKTVGEAMMVSKERVRQIQETALGKLHRFLSSDPVLQ